MARVISTFLQDIFIYPIKSLGGISLNFSQTEERGLPFDRRWLLVDKNNAFLTQRKHVQMALLKTSIEEAFLTVRHTENKTSSIKIPLNIKPGKKILVTVFDDPVEATLVEDIKIEQWFSKALGEEVKLVFMDASAQRLVDSNYATNEGEVSFADGFPYLVTNQASLDDLNLRLDQPVAMNRFRPNLVISGAQPYEEDNWKQIIIGPAVFDVIKPCGRCKIIMIDQETAEKGQEPLTTLSTYRKFNNKIIFGQNLMLSRPGSIQVGDGVKIVYK